LALSLLEAFGGPVVAPSANPSGRISPTTAEHVRQGLGNKVHMILDGGPCEVGLESTVVSCLGDEPVILRLGGLDRAEIAKLLGFPVRIEHSGKELHAPGQLESHYAPRAALRLDAAAPRQGEAYLGFGDQDGRYNLSRSASLVEAAANLFRMLHELDAAGAQTIAVAPIPATGLGEAINDRLKRAAAPRIPA
jgi:L-threonylcarbamoyladenylate synthase